jgi:N-acetylglucosamine-6-phosphate deacetylase
MKNLYIKNGMVFLDGRFQRQNIIVRDGIISGLEKTARNVGSLPELDASCRVAPGFIDVHTHGGAGVDVNAANAVDLEKVSRFFASHGTTSWLASVLTDTEEQTLWCIGQITRTLEKGTVGAQLLGIHLEGPFLSADYKGAMPEHLLRRADVDLFKRYQKAANGCIRYITVSPEVEGVPAFIREIRDLGAVIAIGHSGADYETAWDCIRNGASSATHTFNSMKLLHQHFPAISGAVLESDIYCEAICDGQHLHPGMVRLLLKTKGLNRVVAITDSIMAAGMPDGRYRLGVNDIVVRDDDVQLANGSSRAGSTLTTDVALKNLIKFTGRPLEELLPLLTENPANMLKIDEHKGSIAPGKDADLILLDGDCNVTATVVNGTLVYQK